MAVHQEQGRHHPEAAREERPLRGLPWRRRKAPDVLACAKLPLDGVHGSREHPIRARESKEAHQQQRRVDRVLVGGHHQHAVARNTLPQDGVADDIPFAGQGLIGAEDPNRPVEGHPRHDPPDGIVTLVSPELPDAVIGLAPDCGDMMRHRSHHSPHLRVQRADQNVVLEGPFESLAEDVQLVLAIGAIPTADGTAVEIAAYSVQLSLFELCFGIEPVHDLQVVVRRPAGAYQELPETVRFAAVAEHRQRIEQEGAVANPAVAIVEVGLATRHLWKRRGHGRGDRS